MEVRSQDTGHPVVVGARPPAPGVVDSSTRSLHVDHIKVLLIGLVIAAHGILGYSELGFWPYAEMNEATLSGATHTLLYALVGPTSLVLIPTLFLIAGLLTPGSLERKGSRGFARDRLVRLGIPFAVYVLVVQPVLMYPFHPPGQRASSFWRENVRGDQASLDSGPLWFVGVLLLYSLAFAAWVQWRRPRPHGALAIRPARLASVVLGLALATFATRLVPLGQSNPIVSLNVWEWPGCLTVFAIGIAGYRRGWLHDVPARLSRSCRPLTLAALLGFVGFAATADILGTSDELLWGGWHWAALLFVTLETTLAVFGSIWVLSLAQRHLERQVWWAGPAVRRSAYGAFLLQTPVLIGLAVALRPLPLPAELKALLVAVTGVVASFALAWLVIRRTPTIASVL